MSLRQLPKSVRNIQEFETMNKLPEILEQRNRKGNNDLEKLFEQFVSQQLKNKQQPKIQESKTAKENINSVVQKITTRIGYQPKKKEQMFNNKLQKFSHLETFLDVQSFLNDMNAKKNLIFDNYNQQSLQEQVIEEEDEEEFNQYRNYKHDQLIERAKKFKTNYQEFFKSLTLNQKRSQKLNHLNFKEQIQNLNSYEREELEQIDGQQIDFYGNLNEQIDHHEENQKQKNILQQKDPIESHSQRSSTFKPNIENDQAMLERSKKVIKLLEKTTHRIYKEKMSKNKRSDSPLQKSNEQSYSPKPKKIIIESQTLLTPKLIVSDCSERDMNSNEISPNLSIKKLKSKCNSVRNFDFKIGEFVNVKTDSQLAEEKFNLITHTQRGSEGEIYSMKNLKSQPSIAYKQQNQDYQKVKSQMMIQSVHDQSKSQNISKQRVDLQNLILAMDQTKLDLKKEIPQFNEELNRVSLNYQNSVRKYRPPKLESLLVFEKMNTDLKPIVRSRKKNIVQI